MERLNELSKQAHEYAVKRGFWSEELSPEHYLMLVITEIAEMVEADREDKRANILGFELAESCGEAFNNAFEGFIKNTVEDEMADVAIRLLDLAGGIGCTEIKKTFLFESNTFRFSEYTFTETAFKMIKTRLDSRIYSYNEIVSNTLYFLFDWAKYLRIDLFKHIDIKMKYNETREFKHGKKY